MAGFLDVDGKTAIRKVQTFFDVWTVLLFSVGGISILAVAIFDAGISKEGKLLSALLLSVVALTVSAVWCGHHVRLFLKAELFDYYTKYYELRVIAALLVPVAVSLGMSAMAIAKLGNLPL